MSAVVGRHEADLAYRRDIDGLRAVAILLVLFYHLGLGVPGGYVGVDVFFVISGYLITGIIDRQAQRSAFSYLDFYERRARRILPALAVVLFASSLAALYFLLPTDLERYGKSLLATLAFVSNFFFWSQGSYFGPASDLAPLLHTWSLAVEEQFYLVLPPLYLAYRRWFPRRPQLAFLIVFVVSLAAAAWFIGSRAQEVFYWSPFRAWELALGGWLAVAQPPTLATRAARNGVSLLGLALILVAGFGFDADTPFPGPSALLPCVGAALLLWSGSQGRSISDVLLGNRVMVFFGLISYSLYLWHWPLAAYARHLYQGEPFPMPVGLVVGVAAVVLATLSWRFVEQPFRSRQSVGRRALLGWSASVVGLLVAASAVLVAANGLPGRFSPEVAVLDRERVKAPYRDECLNPAGKLSVAGACRIGAEGEPQVLVWGDSYAYAMMPAFDAAFERLGISGIFLARTGCPPFPGSRISLRGRENWKCSRFNEEVLALLRSEDALTTVVLAAAWNSYADSETGYRVEAPGAGADGFARSADAVVGALRGPGSGKSVVVVEQVPSYPWNVPYRMAVSIAHGESLPIISREQHDERSVLPSATFAGLRDSGRVRLIRPVDWFCAGQDCRYADGEGRPYYFDHGHINRRGADFIAPRLQADLAASLQAAGPPPKATK